MPGEVVALMLCSLARTLADTHGLHILHRDVKPANVLMDFHHPGRLVLIDFNVAKLAGRNLRLTAKGERPGSPAYMSPEQTRAWKLDQRTDIFSLGILGYELAVGMLPFGPFEHETLVVGADVERLVMQRIRRGTYDRATLARVRPGYVREAIERCLRVRREERWQTMGELADFLGERLGRDGLGLVEMQLGQYVRTPEAYAATLGARVLEAAQVGVHAAWRKGQADVAEERLQRLMEMMPVGELPQLLDELGRELARREAAERAQAEEEKEAAPEAAEKKEAEGKAEGKGEQATDAEPPVVPPVPPVKGKGPKPEEMEAELAKAAEAWLAQVAKGIGRESKRGWRPVAGWRMAAMAAVVLALVAGGVWWKIGSPKESGEGEVVTAAAREAFRRAIGGMTEVDEVKVYAIAALRAGRRAAFEEMMQILDEKNDGTEVSQGLLAALATSGSDRALDWMLGHMKRSPERHSAHLVAIVLGQIAERTFQNGKLPDPRIVPNLVHLAAGLRPQGTAKIWPPLKALATISQYQKLAEADLLALVVLNLAEKEGDRADGATIEDAARILLTNGGKLAEEQLQAQMEGTENDVVRRFIQTALRRYAVEKML